MKNLKQDCDAVGRPSILINTLEMEANIISYSYRRKRRNNFYGHSINELKPLPLTSLFNGSKCSVDHTWKLVREEVDTIIQVDIR